MRNHFLISCSFLLVFSLSAKAQDGSFDPTFGSNGILTLTGGASDNLSAVVVQPDGKLLLGGVSRTGTPVLDRFYINRLLSNGTTDISFNGGVPRIIEDSSNAIGAFVALKADGSIVYAGGRGPNSFATMGRLNADGSDAVLPVGPYPNGPTNLLHNITAMSYNPVNDDVAVGGFVNQTDYFMFTYRFKSNGALNSNYNGTGKQYFGGPPVPPTTSKYVFSRGIINLNDGSTLQACNLAYGGNFTVVKFKPNGTLDNTFGVNGVSRDSIDPSYGNPEGLLVLPNGKIMVYGGSQIGGGRFTVIRLHPDGAKDNSFNAIPIGAGLNNNQITGMIAQPDGKLIACGTTTPFSGAPFSVIIRYKEDGSLDSTFGVNGMINLSGIVLSEAAISVSDRKAIFVGRNTSGQMTIVKIKYGVQPFNILGKDVVAVETENDFVIHPTVPGYSYIWNYSSGNVYTLGSSTSDTLTLYFNKTSPSGTLSCSIFDLGGSLVKKVDKLIKVNPEPTLAELLEDVQCGQAQSYSDENYINSFRINQTKLISVNTGASASGYNDLTASGNYDTLYLGDNYQAGLECVNTNGQTIYAGVWIDFNNDGKMETSGEFVGAAASNEKNFTVNNIVVPSDAEAGPKRVRVRIRQTGPFTSEDCCITNEEISETEDYLVVLGAYTGIKVPNFITPNNDGKNDNFIVRGVKAELSNSLKVFNRVGDLVYDQNNYDNSWGGSDKSGGQLKPGTYYFVFTQTNPDKSKDDVVKGFFEIRY